MLYNPEWKQKPRDIWSLDSLIQWLDGQTREECYDYGSRHSCLLAQYFTDMGLKRVSVSCVAVTHARSWWNPFRKKETVFPRMFDHIAASHCTFGDALLEARRYRVAQAA